jgi:hypothetical protein
MKFLIALVAFGTSASLCSGQTIVGTWQMVKHSSCVDDDMEMDSASEDMVNDMKSMSGPDRQVLILKDNNSAEESTRIISKRKSYNSKSFLYKFNGEAIYFLDKKSKTIIEGYTVEKFSADSLIISNTERVCETKIFIRIK